MGHEVAYGWRDAIEGEVYRVRSITIKADGLNTKIFINLNYLDGTPLTTTHAILFDYYLWDVVEVSESTSIPTPPTEDKELYL